MNLIPIFLIGLLGSVHCIGMCGGIVGALSITSSGSRSVLSRTFSYNIGRISSYTIAGTLAGGVYSGAHALAGIAAWQSLAFVLSNLMLMALGLYLMTIWRGLTQLELIGHRLWRRIQPLAVHLFPLDTPIKLVLAGILWGWLPCGMVYSVLLTAMFSGSAISGAAVMLAFGLGTLPMLLVAGVFGAQIRLFLQHRAVQLTSGATVFGFGVLGLMHAAKGLPNGWVNAICT